MVWEGPVKPLNLKEAEQLERKVRTQSQMGARKLKICRRWTRWAGQTWSKKPWTLKRRREADSLANIAARAECTTEWTASVAQW
jgi:hypothetical protein